MECRKCPNDHPPNAPLPRDEVIARLSADNSPFATSLKSIRGVEFQVFTHAPTDLRDFFTFSNTHYPEREFLIYGEQRLTFGDVHRKSVALFKSPQRLGVEPGDRVAPR